MLKHYRGCHTDDLVVQSQRFRRRSPLAIVAAKSQGMSDGRFISVAIALAGEGGYPQQTGKSLSACQKSDF